jgi:hypothetical protein
MDIYDTEKSKLDLRHTPRDYGVQEEIDILDRYKKNSIIRSYLSNINFCECHNYEIELLESLTTGLQDMASTTSSNSAKKSLCSNIQIISQIGSDSVDGIVYKISINDIDAVMKVMPITDEKLLNQNKNEIMLANICSELVTTQKSAFFPIVYGSYFCNNIKYKSDCKFLNISLKYEISKILENWGNRIISDSGIVISRGLKTKLKRFRTINYVTNTELFTSKDISIFLDYMIQMMHEYFHDLGLEMPDIDKESLLSTEEYKILIPKLQGNILISEIANADIVNYSIKSINEGQILPDNIWLSIIEGVLIGIKDLQTQNIIHKDLHPGNVLVLINTEQDTITSLIHDFGHSEIIDVWSYDDNRSTDILTFLSKILTYQLNILNPETGEPARITDSMTQNIKRLIDNLLSFIEDETKKPILNSPHFMDHIIDYFIHEQVIKLKGGLNKTKKTSSKKYKKKTKKRNQVRNIKKNKKNKKIKFQYKMNFSKIYEKK